MIRWILILMAVLIAIPGLALDLRSDGTVNIERGQVINDDLLVSGGTVNMRGTVNGDLVVMTGTAEVDGRVSGDLIVAGGTVNVRQPVGGSVYIAGGTVNLNSTVARNVAVAGGTVNSSSEMRVGRDLAVAGGTVNVAGNVTRDVKASAGTLTLASTARVGRNLYAQTSNPNIEQGAVIAGTQTIVRPTEHRERRGAGVAARILWAIFSFISLFIAGAVFIALAPHLTRQSVAMISRHPLATVGVGFLILVAVPIIILLCVITLIGIPLALLLLWLYLFALMISPIFPALWLGWLILRRSSASPYLALLIGLAIYVVLSAIPILGGLVMLAALVFGLGAIGLALQSRTRRPLYPETEPAAVPPPAAE